MLYKMIENGCSVGFFGLGRSNLALMKCLPLDSCLVRLRSDFPIDDSVVEQLGHCDEIFVKEESCLRLDEDILIFSPSVRRERDEFIRAVARGVRFTSDAELFYERNTLPLFGVTGSDGKSTTTALITAMLCEGGVSARAVGNIGQPMNACIGDGSEMYVAELSSFMLRYKAPHTSRACLTNISENHLDWHKSFEEYKKTKISLLENSEKAVVPSSVALRRPPFLTISDGEFRGDGYVYVDSGYICVGGERIIETRRILHKGEHNIKNFMTAIAMTYGLVDRDAIGRVAESFDGLDHRCRLISSFGGVDYYDSSIDTSPARTAQTLRSLGRRCVVILGGKNKGLDYRKMLPEVKKYVRYAVLTGESAGEIRSAIGSDVECIMESDFTSAVTVGHKMAKEIGVLLLSPASASYDCFTGYEERGRKYAQIIAQIHKKERKCK